MNVVWRSVALLLVPAAFLAHAHAAELVLPRDGWVSWQVAAVDDAPAWCCFGSEQAREHTRSTCRLDDGPDGFGSRNGEASTDAVKIYARLAAGKVDRLQALSGNCPVETRTPIRDLGPVPADDSTRWLIARVSQEGGDVGPHRSLSESALAALAIHRGDLARDALADFARRGNQAETRKQAVFWLAMVRGAEGAAITSSVMFSAPEAELRQHAAFALAQTQAPRAAPDLVRLGNTDKVADVRAQAWFWLAQTGAAEAEHAISAALGKDADEHVREQAIFALSQLPEERATRALIAAAEDRSLSREQRRRAVFWLAQSKSDSAQGYLERVLAGSSTD